MHKIISYKKSLLDLLGNYEHDMILDFGCGNGDFIELILNSDKKPSKILAVDADKNMIANIEKRFSYEMKNGQIQTLISDSPTQLNGKFDKIICHNVLECVGNKLDFINAFKKIMAENSIFILSHHDFDSAIYNSNFKELSRNLVHHFSDTKQDWMRYSDGQMGRKIPGLINHSVFKENTKIQTWRLVETTYSPGTYGYLMADMIMEIANTKFENSDLKAWRDDLEKKSQNAEYYFSIDLVIAVCRLV